MTTRPEDDTFRIADFEHDELTQLTARMHVTVARWPQDLRDQVVDLLDGVSLECAVRGRVEDDAAADLLTLVRRIVRATEEHIPTTPVQNPGA